MLAEARLDCTVEVYMSQESEEGVTVIWKGAAPGVRAAKSSEFGEGNCEHLRWTHLEHVQHCTDLPR